MKKYLLVYAMLLTPMLVFGQHKLTLNFKGMTPHIGQLMEIRIVEIDRSLEVGRTKAVIGLDEFSVDLYVLMPGKSYQVDFYADFSFNGSYDAPPTDHAWRLTTGQVNDDTELDFTHNITFTDIDFPQPIPLTSLTGTWLGEWVNPTFSVDGTVAATFTFDSQTQIASAEWQAWDLFGLSDPLTFAMEGVINPDPWTVTLTAKPPWTGAVILFDGQITGGITYTDQGITATVTGNYGTNQMIAYYNMIGSVVAEEYGIVEREMTTNVQYDNNLNTPEYYFLYSNYPNPFNPATTIHFNIAQSGPVSLKVYNAFGQEVASLVDGNMNAGYQSVSFQATELPSGVYFYRLKVPGFRQTRKMTLIR